jgi:hypothetical protein
LDWLGLAWTGLDWLGLAWTGLDWLGLAWTGLHDGSGAPVRNSRRGSHTAALVVYLGGGMSAGNWWAPRGRGSGMPCLSLLITMTIAYRHPPAQQQQTPWAQRPTSPPPRLSTFPPCPLFQTPHDVALDVAIESLSLSLDSSVCLSVSAAPSVTRSLAPITCQSAAHRRQHGMTTTTPPATPTPTRRQDRANTKHPPISNYIPEPASITQHPLHVAFVCPGVSCLCTSVPRSPACPCAPSRVLSLASIMSSIQP